MNNSSWNNLEEPYRLRSNKYKAGKYLDISRKHEGVIDYLDSIFKNTDLKNIAFCDAGCGNGVYLKYLQEKYQDIEFYGFDFSDTIVNIAKENTGLKNIKIGNLENAPFEDEKFDIILCTQVIEHLLDEKKGLAELYRILKRNGFLIISTDNKDNSVTKFIGWPIRILFSPFVFFKKKLISKNYFPHKDYTFEEFQNLIKTQKFKIQKKSTFRFSWPYPLYKIKFLVKILDQVEKKLIKKDIFKNKGDLLIALCQKL